MELRSLVYGYFLLEINMMQQLDVQVLPLRQRWQAFMAQSPRARVRDAARDLGVSELELLVLQCGESHIRLEGDFADMLKEVATLGRVMALTRNEYCVHERKGLYRNMTFRGGMGLALGEEIDLRLFMTQWAHAFAVEERTADGFRRSLQFFDVYGDAVHKVHLMNASDVEVFKALVQRFRAQDQSDEVEVEARPGRVAECADEQIDLDGLLAGWNALKDVHDFHALLKTYGVSRTQALRLAGPARAWRVKNTAHADILLAASETDLPIMVFVGNRGCVQIHRGSVHHVKRIEGWFNVLDPNFNLHLVEAGVAQTYVVRKPTVDGVITSLELFDAEGLPIATFFGDRHAGHAENPAWRAIVEALEPVDMPV